MNNQLTLEGIVTNSKYSMTIKDSKGAVIDKLSVAVEDGNDIANRINESINTLNKLSPIYDEQMRVVEDEEFEDLPEATPGDMSGAISSLKEIYVFLMDLGDSMNSVTDYFKEDDVEGKNQIIAFVSSIYDVALDIDEYINDKEEELASEEVPTESLKSKSRRSNKNIVRDALNNITVAEALLHRKRDYADIQKALKNIVAEMKLRSID